MFSEIREEPNLSPKPDISCKKARVPPLVIFDNGMRVFEPCEKNVDISKLFDEVFEEYEAAQAAKRADNQTVIKKCANK